MAGSVSMRLRASKDRGHADHGWLKTYHTFSFANYYDPSFESFGPLRVINEDRVDPGEGFGKHPHREAEIWSYIVSGALKHNDSLGGQEIMRRGDVQMTSVGTGVAHSEYNGSDKEPVHFLQIWALPNQRGLKPQYYHRHFSDAEKTDKLVKIVAPVKDADVTDKREANGPAPVHADLSMFATLLSPGKTLSHDLSAGARGAYVHFITTSYRSPRSAQASPTLEVTVGDKKLKLAEGDGAFIEGKVAGTQLSLQQDSGSSVAEVLLFETV